MPLKKSDVRSDALRIIVAEYLWNNERGEGRTAVARRAGIEKKQLDNFLLKQMNTCEEALKNGFRDLVTERKYWLSRPVFVRQAIREVYDIRSVSVVDDVFQRVTSTRPDDIRSIAECYGATIWDVFRYAAHDDRHGYEAEKVGENEWNAYIVRAAMQVEADTADGLEFPKFTIHYRPGTLAVGPEIGPASSIGSHAIRATEGCVLPLRGGNYMSFFGVEAETRYPLEIRAPRRLVPQDSFMGLVKRHLENGGDPITARAAFVRSTAKSLEELDDKIGMLTERQFNERFSSEFPQIKAILRSIRNLPKYGGKAALWL